MFLRTIVNCILYINSSKANVIKVPSERPARPPKTPTQEEKADRLTKYAYYSVGPDVTFYHDPVSLKYATSRDGQKHSYRYLVRGHYRNQPCGPARSQHEVIWIEPHWRGPDTGEVLGRAYVIRHGMRDERDW